MEVVILREMMATYASNWTPIATTQGTDTLHVGDVFREAGSGEGAEEMKVEAFEISPIAGGSRLLLLRCHHSTKPQSYRLGAVLRRLEPELVGPAKRTRKPAETADLLSDV
jgi:hypothetical protein